VEKTLHQQQIAVETESYNGTSWSEVNDLGTGRRDFSGFGTSTAAVAVGGYTPPGVSTYNALVEKWDGTNWTAAPNALPTATAATTGWGTQTAGLVAGGNIPGTSWSYNNLLNMMELIGHLVEL
jgi:hypothetical protein